LHAIANERTAAYPPILSGASNVGERRPKSKSPQLLDQRAPSFRVETGQPLRRANAAFRIAPIARSRRLRRRRRDTRSVNRCKSAVVASSPLFLTVKPIVAAFSPFPKNADAGDMVETSDKSAANSHRASNTSMPAGRRIGNLRLDRRARCGPNLPSNDGHNFITTSIRLEVAVRRFNPVSGMLIRHIRLLSPIPHLGCNGFLSAAVEMAPSATLIRQFVAH
jgi:hypothetical protein